MPVVICTFQEDHIKLTRLCSGEGRICFWHSRANNSVINGPIWSDFELVQTIKPVLYESMMTIRSKMKAHPPIKIFSIMSIWEVQYSRAMNLFYDLSHVTRKPDFGMCDKMRLKPACSADKIRSGLEISAIASRGITLSRQRTTNALIRLR